jgi:hypothetical protein
MSAFWRVAVGRWPAVVFREGGGRRGESAAEEDKDFKAGFEDSRANPRSQHHRDQALHRQEDFLQRYWIASSGHPTFYLYMYLLFLIDVDDWNL